ncbi:putative uncharacterized protein DDB_G0277255 [Clytia hemisphaerica]|eukprot:TCONS_00060876-protein
MVASNPYHLPIKAVVSNEGGNPIMDSLKSKMKEMNINKERLDRTSSVSNEKKGNFLSQSSRESAARAPSPLPAPKSPTSPAFKMTLAKGESPFAAGAESNVLMASLKNTIEGDRMTLGLRQTRGMAAGSHSPSMQRMKTAFHEDDKRNNITLRNDGYCNVLPPDQSSFPVAMATNSNYNSVQVENPNNSTQGYHRQPINSAQQEYNNSSQAHYRQLSFEKQQSNSLTHKMNSVPSYQRELAEAHANYHRPPTSPGLSHQRQSSNPALSYNRQPSNSASNHQRSNSSPSYQYYREPSNSTTISQTQRSKSVTAQQALSLAEQILNAHSSKMQNSPSASRKTSSNSAPVGDEL